MNFYDAQYKREMKNEYYSQYRNMVLEENHQKIRENFWLSCKNKFLFMWAAPINFRKEEIYKNLFEKYQDFDDLISTI